MSPPADTPPLWPGARWFDDWFAVEQIDQHTVAIAEPRYWQYQVSYLLLGDRRALLFDSGSGRRDIRPVVAAFTALPVTVAFSHPHFDHLGNHPHFDRFAAFDHPELRARVRDNLFHPSLVQHLKLRRPRFPIHEWWPAWCEVDLGHRSLTVIPVPGHSPESIALFDPRRGQLFLGDFLYNAELYIVDVDRYLGSLQMLRDLTAGPQPLLLGAHGLPRVPYAHLRALARLLAGVRAGRIRPRSSLGGFLLAPQRRVRAGELDVRLLHGGRLALLLPLLLGAGLIATLAALISVLASPKAGALTGLAVLTAGLIAYERL
jgi:glyoxylase-like metal-dependent hydrolase (beta-lactamase superfamily II)